MSEERSLTVGQYLRQERERKNISLETVARATRISLEKLQALERDDFQAISAPIIARGFLRNYASHLGLDPKELIARYDSQMDLVKISPRIKESTPAKADHAVFKYVFFLSLIVVGVAIGFYFFQRAPAPPTRTPPLATLPPPSKPVAQPPPSPRPSPVEEVPPKAPKAAPQPEKEKEKKQPEKLPAAAASTKEEPKPKEERHNLKVIAVEKTWLRIKPDDQAVIDVLLQPKETASWSARGRFDMTVGNAGGVEIFFNGVSQGSLGKSGEVVHLTLPKETKVILPSQKALAREPPPSKEAKPVEIKPFSQEVPSKENKPPNEEKEAVQDFM